MGSRARGRKRRHFFDLEDQIKKYFLEVPRSLRRWAARPSTQPDCRSYRCVKRPSWAARDFTGRREIRSRARVLVLAGAALRTAPARMPSGSLLRDLAVSAAAARNLKFSLAELPTSRSPCKIRESFPLRTDVRTFGRAVSGPASVAAPRIKGYCRRDVGIAAERPLRFPDRCRRLDEISTIISRLAVGPRR
jgi:hypothetical protein